MNGRLAYTVSEASKMLSISRSRLYELINSGEIQSVKFGRSRRITEEQLREFLRRCEVALPKPIWQ